MNRSRVITDEVPFSEFKKTETKNRTPNKKKIYQDFSQLKEIIKFANNKKETPNNRKRKRITKQLFVEYLDTKYNIDDY